MSRIGKLPVEIPSGVEVKIDGQTLTAKGPLGTETVTIRPEITMEFLSSIIDIPYKDDIKEQVSIYLKYEGYINKAYKERDKMLKLEKKQIPEDIDYNKITNIASEARQKLEEVRPKTIAQAIRISGVNPSDISILSVYLKKEYGKDES